MKISEIKINTAHCHDELLVTLVVQADHEPALSYGQHQGRQSSYGFRRAALGYAAGCALTCA